MKKTIAIAALALVAATAYAALDSSTGFKNEILVTPTAGLITPVTNSVVDKNDYTGMGNVILAMGLATNATSTITLDIQTAAAATGTFASADATTVTALSNATVCTEIPYDFTSGKRYIRAVVITSNGVVPNAAIINGYK